MNVLYCSQLKLNTGKIMQKIITIKNNQVFIVNNQKEK